MASNRILALNVGASQVTLAEFSVAPGKQPLLTNFGSKSLHLDPENDADPAAFITDGVRTIMRERGIRPGSLTMAISGQMVFPRFVKIPPVQADKMEMLIRSEAEQNVPFPIDEVVWDYQRIGDASSGDQNVMIVAAKNASVTSLANSVGAVQLEPQTVDVAPLTIANLAFASGAANDGCSLVIDIGARSTNLIFIEDGRTFYRSIPIAGNTITQEIAKTYELSFFDAEQFKNDVGFVALGGSYATGDEDADKVSKIIRNVLTRLHAEINRSISFYRSQQEGSQPVRAYLTGGSARMKYMDVFFKEKLHGVDVQFLNPFEVIAVAPQISEVAAQSFSNLSEVAGLALRAAGNAKIEINLIPKFIVTKVANAKKVPCIIASAVFFILAALIYSISEINATPTFEAQEKEAEARSSKMESKDKALKNEIASRDKVKANAEAISKLIREKTLVRARFDKIREALLDGMWLESITTLPPEEEGGEELICIKGRGFTNKLKKVEAEQTSKKTASEVFVDRLLETKAFTKATIQNDRDMPNLTMQIHEFEIVAELAPEYKVRKAGEH